MSHGYIPKTIKTLCSCTSCAALCFNPSIRLSTINKRQSNMFTGKNNHHYADYEKTTRAERLEMIRFEDSLQNLLLFSRNKSPVKIRGKRNIEVEDLNTLHSEKLEQRDFVHYPFKWDGHLQINATINTIGNDESVGSNTIEEVSINGLHHYTEYLFVISACHSPHNINGEPLFMSNLTHFNESNYHLIVEMPWCSTQSVVQQRTEASIGVDDIDPDSIELVDENLAAIIDNCLTSELLMPPPMKHRSNVCDLMSNLTLVNHTQFYPTKMDKMPSSAASSSSLLSPPKISVKQLRWRPPTQPNGLTLHYWIRYRRLDGESTANNVRNDDDERTWSSICLNAINLPMLSNQNIVSVQLYDLRPGLYEFQIMSVSLAGNGSWTTVKRFKVSDTSVHTIWDFLEKHYYIVIIGFLCSIILLSLLAIYIERRISRKRLENKPWHNEQWELFNAGISNDWIIPMNNLLFNTDDTPLGRGSFGMVYKGLLLHLSTPASQQLFNENSNQLIKEFNINSKYFISKKGSTGFDVAVKTLFPASTMDDIREFYNEASFMKKLNCKSYGVVLWEIATFASLPYPGLSHEEVMKFVCEGGHLNLPECPAKLPVILLTLMNMCWEFEPIKRPTFNEILLKLKLFTSTECI
ncbi:unnamed protein product [Schistosoma turkestanicum]|nr:unnamed protein product [Schistosoma turkestanicum]